MLIVGALFCALLGIAPRAVALDGDQALVELREQLPRGDLVTYDALAASIDPTHPLAAYVPFWRLLMQLDDRFEPSDRAALDAQVAAYVDANPASVFADRILAPWLRSLGRRSLWRLFDTYYPKWVERNDDEVMCLAGQSAASRGIAPDDAVMRIWRERRELGDECSRLSLRLFEAGLLKRDAIARRMRRALEDKAPATIRSTGRLLGIGAEALETAINSPARALAYSADPRVTLIALGLLARPAPEIAAARLAERSDLAPADRRLLWGIIGASAARDLEPGAWQWARQGLDAELSSPTREWLVRAAMLAGDWAGVIQAIDRLDPALAATPRWAYWRARALRETGQPEAAQALLLMSAGVDDFYRLLAADTVGQAAGFPQASTPHGALASPGQAELLTRPPFVRAIALYRLGLRHDAAREWQYAIRGLDDEQLLAAARLACEKQILDRCVVTATRTRERHDWSLRFLTPFRDRLVAAARANRLDPAWVYGLIRQESRFLIDARSGVGAKGLMQIMPATGRWIAKQRGISEFRTAHLDELDTNLDFGAWYMSHVFDSLDKSLPLASAGYNAGPRRPQRWRAKMPRTVDGALFTELIPFDETRQYVQNVLSNTVMYASLLTGEPASIRRLLGQVMPNPAPGQTDDADTSDPEAPLM